MSNQSPTDIQNTHTDSSDPAAGVDLERQDTVPESLRTRITEWVTEAGRRTFVETVGTLLNSNHPVTTTLHSMRVEQGGVVAQAGTSLIIVLELGMHLSGAYGSASGGEIVDDTSASPGADAEVSEPDVALTTAADDTAESTRAHTETGEQVHEQQ